MHVYPLPCALLVRSRTGTGPNRCGPVHVHKETRTGPNRYGPEPGPAPVAAGPNRLRGPGPGGRARTHHQTWPNGPPDPLLLDGCWAVVGLLRCVCVCVCVCVGETKAGGVGDAAVAGQRGRATTAEKHVTIGLLRYCDNNLMIFGRRGRADDDSGVRRTL